MGYCSHLEFFSNDVIFGMPMMSHFTAPPLIFVKVKGNWFALPQLSTSSSTNV